MQSKLSQGALRTLVTALLVAPVSPAMAQLSDDAALQLLQKVNELEQELRTLRGDNEELQHELQKLRSQQQQSQQQFDEKLDKLATEKQADAPPTTAANPTDKSSDVVNNTPSKTDTTGFYSYGTGKSDDKNIGILQANQTKSLDLALPTKTGDAQGEKNDDNAAEKPSDKTDDKTDDKTADKATLTTSQTDTGTSKLGGSPSDERAMYDHAFQTLLQDPQEAIPEFRDFLKNYPKSPLAPSAQYWIGEALYAEKDYKAASEEFLTVLKEHKDSDKAADAALKLGFCFYELKDWEKARKTLEDVITFFPKNEETAKLAQERLDKMKKDGH